MPQLVSDYNDRNVETYVRRRTEYVLPAYIFSDVSVRNDAAALEAYRTFAATSIAQYGGRYLVRMGMVEALEGDWCPRAVVLAEFPDVERARLWCRSPEYALALEHRDAALSRNLILLGGVPLSTEKVDSAEGESPEV